MLVTVLLPVCLSFCVILSLPAEYIFDPSSDDRKHLNAQDVSIINRNIGVMHED